MDAIVASGPDGDRVYTLKGADEAYRVMVQSMAEGALTVTRDGLILFSNEQFASMLGDSSGARDRLFNSRLRRGGRCPHAVRALLTGRNGRRPKSV